jgi:cell division transport system permease protein
MSSIRYFLKESLQGFTRNLSTAIGSIVTIFLSLLMIGLFLVAGTMLDTLMTSVEDEITITAYVSDDAAQEDIDTVIATIEKMDNVANVTFTDKEAAAERFKSTSTTNDDIIGVLDGYNPFPASIDVELSDPQAVEDVANAILANELYQQILDNPDNPTDSVKYGQGTVERLLQVTNYARYIGIALVLILIFIALVFINNTIRLAILARKKEISIMRLVGASNGFIRGPFLMEGALHSIIGSLLAIGVLQALRMSAIPRLQDSIRFLDFSVDDATYIMIFVALIAFGLVIGFLGSMLAMRRYLKV